VTSKEEIFRERFSAILAAMQDAPAPEDIAAVGGLANMFVEHSGQASWAGFKAAISMEDYNAILATLQTQGNRLAQEGNRRQVHAIETLAVSLIARTQMRDADIAAGAIILDNLIDQALNRYRSAQPVNPIIS
jgi:hypothetical protein